MHDRVALAPARAVHQDHPVAGGHQRLDVAVEVGPAAGAGAGAVEHHHGLGALAAVVVVQLQVQVALVDADKKRLVAASVMAGAWVVMVSSLWGRGMGGWAARRFSRRGARAETDGRGRHELREQAGEILVPARSRDAMSAWNSASAADQSAAPRWVPQAAARRSPQASCASGRSRRSVEGLRGARSQPGRLRRRSGLLQRGDPRRGRGVLGGELRQGPGGLLAAARRGG